MTPTPRLVLVLGGTRSGKSAFAERLAAEAAATATGATAAIEIVVTYLATGTAVDGSMAARIAAHQQRRPPGWATVECGAALAPALACHSDGVVLVDSLGSWVAGHADLVVDIVPVLHALAGRRGTTVIVSDEVGLAVHPPTEIGRRFVDVIGDVNKAVAAIADEVVLVVAGRPLWFPADGPR